MMSTTECLHSRYMMRDNDNSVFGEFHNQRILGYAASFYIQRLADGNICARDILGSFLSRGMPVIHISGKDIYGKRSGGGRIREIASVRRVWSSRDDTRVEVIVRGILDDDTLHHAEFSPAESFVSFKGIFDKWKEWADVGSGQPFTPAEVLAWINTRRHDRSIAEGGPKMVLKGHQHTAAIRRLLEGMVGYTNESGGAIPGWVLKRTGRSPKAYVFVRR